MPHPIFFNPNPKIEDMLAIIFKNYGFMDCSISHWGSYTAATAQDEKKKEREVIKGKNKLTLKPDQSPFLQTSHAV